MIDEAEEPVYLQIAGKAEHMRNLGLSDRAIARALAVNDKTVAKAIESAGTPTRHRRLIGDRRTNDRRPRPRSRIDGDAALAPDRLRGGGAGHGMVVAIAVVGRDPRFRPARPAGRSASGSRYARPRIRSCAGCRQSGCR